MNYGIGAPVSRKEDWRLLTGTGCFTDDIRPDGLTHAHVLRSPHAHARVKSIATAAARKAPGVLGVFSAEDMLADGFTPVAPPPPSSDVVTPSQLRLAPRLGTEQHVARTFHLAQEKVRRVGECVAFIVAETLAQAKDAAELIEVDYEPLPAVVDLTAAIEPRAPQLWDEIPGNVSLEVERGDRDATERAFADAAHRVSLRLDHNRVMAMFMEPRCAVASYDKITGTYTIYTGTNRSYALAAILARLLGVPPGQVRVIARDVGGNFGSRGGSEELITAWAARKVERPVKWVSERSDALISDSHAREMTSEAELALDEQFRFLAVRVRHLYSTGFAPTLMVPLANGIRLVPNCYRFPTAYAEAKAVHTNTHPTGTYRGAGRPEAVYNLERLIDAAAVATGIDRVEIRRRNLIAPSELPYTSAMGVPYDSGEFEVMLDKALQMADWNGFLSRRQEAWNRGLFRGIAVSCYIQNTTGNPPEWTSVHVTEDDRVVVAIGTDPTGQGHQTSFSQVISEWLGVPFESVEIVTGDSAVLRGGSGSHSDRSMRVGGKIMVEACERIIGKGRRIAARCLEAADDDIEFFGGRFTVAGTDRSIGIFDIARTAVQAGLPEELAGPLEEVSQVDEYLPGYPSGCAVCEVEVDPETGAVAVVRYTSVDDVGRAINPMIVEGQTAGAIAQGLGQAFLENMVYDRETGQPLSGSLMDYCLPRADHFPSFALELHEVPAPSNKLGVKGGGEGGCLPALAVLINAVIDALQDLGVTDLQLPATPENVWRALRDVGA